MGARPLSCPPALAAAAPPPCLAPGPPPAAPPAPPPPPRRRAMKQLRRNRPLCEHHHLQTSQITPGRIGAPHESRPGSWAQVRSGGAAGAQAPVAASCCSGTSGQTSRTSSHASQSPSAPALCMARVRMTEQLAQKVLASGWFSLKASAAGCSYSMAHLRPGGGGPAVTTPHPRQSAPRALRKAGAGKGGGGVCRRRSGTC